MGDNDLIVKVNDYVSPFNSFDELETEIFMNGTIKMKINKIYNDKDIKEINLKIDNIINKLNLENIENDKKKLEIINNELIKTIKYDQSYSKTLKSKLNPATAYGALIENSAVCSGYSDSLSLILDRLNIPNIKISNDKHIWNLVYVDNEWLHVDVTWNDSELKEYQTTFLLIDTQTLKNIENEEHIFERSFYKELI